MSINARQYFDQVVSLYRQQLEEQDSGYLRAHSATRGGILRQVKAAERYLPLVAGRVLDWGCMHALDACLVRMHHGPEVEIHGCDVFPTGLFDVFHGFARLNYKQIDHPYHLPYPDAFFETIIADGVLEHVPNDYESVKELYRVLKPDGLLIISCLPNRRSYLEFICRLLGLPHHPRAYSMRAIRSTLLHSGFETVDYRYLQMTPSLSGLANDRTPAWLKRLASALWSVNGCLEKIWPLNGFSSNLFLMARKRTVITWLPRQAA